MASSRADDTPVQHYTLKHRMVAWVSRNLFDHVTYTVRRGLLKGLKRRGGLAWLPESLAPAPVTAEETFWHRQNLAGMTVYDVGAFQGLMTLFFATRAGRVIAYEPNSVNRARLMKNLELNRVGNVTIRPVGVGAQAMRTTMVNSVDMPGGASIDPGLAESIQKDSNVHVEEIEVVVFDQDLAAQGLPAPDLIKIDVEGLELQVLQGARETLATRHPRLFIEMHGDTMAAKRQNAQAVVDLLAGLGYDDILHVESSTAAGVANATVAAEGHLYCQRRAAQTAAR